VTPAPATGPSAVATCQEVVTAKPGLTAKQKRELDELCAQVRGGTQTGPAK
jgi:hypothetical protein